jgi:hypothetical protein
MKIAVLRLSELREPSVTGMNSGTRNHGGSMGEGATQGNDWCSGHGFARLWEPGSNMETVEHGARK